MREQVWLDDAPGADDTAKGKAALAILASRGGGDLVLPGREIRITETWFVPSNVTVSGQGSATHIRFAGKNPASIPGTDSHTRPRQGNLRTAAIAVAGQYPDDISRSSYRPDHTGDYPVTQPNAFAPNSVIPAGSVVLPLASARGLSIGNYLWLERGYMGWHPAIKEMVLVSEIDGDEVRLSWATQYEYCNASTDPFNAFMKPIAYQDGVAAPGVDQASYNGWRQCGWRRVDPVVNSWVRDLRITNEAKHPGYANLAIIFQRAFNCGFRNLYLSGGGLGNLDSENTTGDGLICKRSSASYQQTDVLPGNGSNRIRLTNIDMHTGSLDVEEGATKGYFQGRTRSNTKNIHFCRDNTFDLVARNDTGYGIYIERCAQVRVRGTYQASQAGIWVGHRDLFYDYPQATLAMWDSLVGLYFDGMNIEIDADRVEARDNNSLDIYLQQPIKGRAFVTGRFGGVYSIPSSGQGFVVGSVKRLTDGSDQTAPRLSARPTFFPFDRDIAITSAADGKVWRRVNLNRKSVLDIANAGSFRVNSHASDGGVRAGDVAKVLIQNSAKVSVDTLKYVAGVPVRTPVSYTAGSARKWHISEVAAFDTATGLVTLATPVPTDWAPITSASDDKTKSCVFFGRWG